MLPCASGRLILLAASLACSAALLCSAQQAQPPESAEIRYHFGDDPDGHLGWANPNFDDSAWPVAKDGQWPMPPFYSDGFVWVRFRIPVRSDASGPLAVRSSRETNLGGLPYSLADEIYVDGLLAGRQGSLPPHVEPDIQRRDAVFDLPVAVATPGKTAVVALRVWCPPHLRRPANPGAVQISIDETRNLQLARRADHATDDYANGLNLALNVGIGLLGIAMFVAWRWTGERDLLVFAWVMIPQALVLLAWSSSLPGVERLPVQEGALVFFVPLTLFMVALVELNWTVHRLHAPLLKRLAQTAAVVFNLALLIPILSTAPTAIAHWAMLAVVPADLIFEPLLIAVNIWAILTRRTNPLLALALLANPSISLLNNTGVLSFSVKLGPFYEHPIALADFVCDVAIFALLSHNAWKAWRARDELRVEFEAARDVQERLVAPAVDLPGFRIQSVYLPSRQVGGDFFRVLPEPDGSVLVIVGDVSGKGLRAAMTVSAIIGALRTMPVLAPARILAALNRGLVGQLQGGFVTCCVAHISADGAMTIANAGNPAPYRNGAEMAVEPGLPLGLVDESTYAEMHYRLAPNDRLTFVSDGVVEATNAQGDLYGFDRTQAASTEHANEIARRAQHFGQQDDITVLTLQRMMPA
jgi:sigma-B regulation protein RsbU (phosphoserine phosphatase)